jgi:hypothetical protein
VPSGHGTYQGLDLELLNPADEGERTFLIEARHPEFEGALRDDEEMVVDGEPFSPALHIARTRLSPASYWPAIRPKPGRPSSGWPGSATTGTMSST